MTAGERVPPGELPPTLGAREVAELWGVARWAVYEHVEDGQLPVAPLRVGRALRWPTALVLEALGIEGCACHGRVTPSGTDED